MPRRIRLPCAATPALWWPAASHSAAGWRQWPSRRECRRLAWSIWDIHSIRPANRTSCVTNTCMGWPLRCCSCREPGTRLPRRTSSRMSSPASDATPSCSGSRAGTTRLRLLVTNGRQAKSERHWPCRWLDSSVPWSDRVQSCQPGQVHAVACTGLPQHVGDVRADGLFADDQGARDFAVCLAGNHEFENDLFPRSESGQVCPLNANGRQWVSGDVGVYCEPLQGFLFGSGPEFTGQCQAAPQERWGPVPPRLALEQHHFDGPPAAVGFLPGQVSGVEGIGCKDPGPTNPGYPPDPAQFGLIQQRKGRGLAPVQVGMGTGFEKSGRKPLLQL